MVGSAGGRTGDTRQWLVVQGGRTGDNYTMIGSSGGRKVTIPQIFQTMLYQII